MVMQSMGCRVLLTRRQELAHGMQGRLRRRDPARSAHGLLNDMAIAAYIVQIGDILATTAVLTHSLSIQYPVMPC